MDKQDTQQPAVVECRMFEGGALLELAGVVDISAARQLQVQALALAVNGTAVLVDCNGCERLDASALQILIALRTHLEANGVTLRLLADESPVRSWLSAAGCDSLFRTPIGDR